MIKDIVIAGIVFVVICFIAVKWKSWFSTTSQSVVTDVTKDVTNVEDVVTGKTTPMGTGTTDGS